MAARELQLVCQHTGMGTYAGCSDIVAATCVRIACAVSLQAISDALREVGGFSIALDASTHQGLSYLDTRVRFTWNGEVVNFHLLAIPLHERHTGENMFNALSKFLDASKNSFYILLLLIYPLY